MPYQIDLSKFETSLPQTVLRRSGREKTGRASIIFLDVSGINSGERIEKIFAGLSAYHRDLRSDRVPRLPTEVALVIFGGWGRVVRDFVVEPHCLLPSQKSSGHSPMQVAIADVTALREKGGTFDTAYDIDWSAPWIFTITNGEASTPQSHHCWERAKALLQEGKAQSSPILIGVRF